MLVEPGVYPSFLGNLLNILNVKISVIFGTIPLLFTIIWGDQPAVNGRYKLPSIFWHQQKPKVTYQSQSNLQQKEISGMLGRIR